MILWVSFERTIPEEEEEKVSVGFRKSRERFGADGLTGAEGLFVGTKDL